MCIRDRFGTVQNGTSVPWFFRWLVRQFGGKASVGAVLHDHFYGTHTVSKKVADVLLASYAYKNGMQLWRVVTIYYAVQLFGFVAWTKKRK